MGKSVLARAWLVGFCTAALVGCGSEAVPNPSTTVATTTTTSGSGGSNVGGGAGASGGSGGAGGVGGAPDGLCGDGPYVNVTAELTSFADATQPVVGAKLTVDLCPEEAWVTDASGKLSGSMTANVAHNPKLVADGYLPTRTGQQILTADFDASSGLIAAGLVFLIPHYDPEKPTVMAAVSVKKKMAGDPCHEADGAVFSVVGHPEATVTYYAGSQVPSPDPAMTATGPLGLAEISGLEATGPGEYIELTVDKPTCADVSFVSYPFTGKFRLEKGVLTLAGAFMPPTAPP